MAAITAARQQVGEDRAPAFSVYRREAHSDQPARRAAGPFPSWRDAFLARCALAQAALRASGASRDSYSVRAEPLYSAVA